MLKPHLISTAPFVAFLVCLAHPLIAHAETKVITTEATYTMGDGETPSFAEAQVLQRAKQLALEQAGTYVESYTKVQNLNLTTEEIQTLAGGVMTIEVLDKSRALVGDGLKLSIKIKATVTTDKMEELARRIKGKNVAEEYQKLQAEYARLSREVETWKQLAAKTAEGPEREAALDQIRERERAFARVQQNEAVLFQRLVSGQALVAEGLDEKALVNRLIESIKKDGHVVEIGKVSGFPRGPLGNELDLFKVTIPITLKASAILPHLLTDAARSLGGDAMRPRADLSPVKYNLNLPWYDGRVKVRSGPTVGYRSILPSTKGAPLIEWVSFQTVPTQLRLSHNEGLQSHFKGLISRLRFMVELNDDTPEFAPMSCTVPLIVNRLVVVPTIVDLPLPESEEDMLDQVTSVFLLADTITFTIEADLPTKVAKRIAHVSARWVDSLDATPEWCRIIVGKS